MSQQQDTRPSKLARRELTAPAAAEGPMAQLALDEEDWQHIQQQLSHYDAHRETVIKRSRDAQKASKQAIYSLLRGDFDRAAQQHHTAEQVGRELLPIVQEEPTLRQGSFAAAMEEYAEGVVLRTYLREGRIPKSTELAELVNTEEYLAGVLDFTGELNRYAVGRATARDVGAVQRARDVVDALQGQFLHMDLRNGSLRKKFDSLKYTLNKLEAMLYDLSLAGTPGLRATQGQEEQQQPAADGAAADDA